MVLRPAIRGGSDDRAIGSSESDVDTDRQAVQAKCPEDVWEKHDLKCMLSWISMIRIGSESEISLTIKV